MFKVHAGFCTHCGSVLPSIGIVDFVSCYVCNRRINVKDFGSMKSDYTIYFNSVENIDIAKKNKNKTNSDNGPVAEKICKQCGHNQMSYAAIQLRSADEGQTVFYTCVKCKFTESENS